MAKNCSNRGRERRGRATAGSYVWTAGECGKPLKGDCRTSHGPDRPGSGRRLSELSPSFRPRSSSRNSRTRRSRRSTSSWNGATSTCATTAGAGRPGDVRQRRPRRRDNRLAVALPERGPPVALLTRARRSSSPSGSSGAIRRRRAHDQLQPAAGDLEAEAYQGHGVALLDLIQEGVIGLIRAVRSSTGARASSSRRTRPGGFARPCSVARQQGPDDPDPDAPGRARGAHNRAAIASSTVKLGRDPTDRRSRRPRADARQSRRPWRRPVRN